MTCRFVDSEYGYFHFTDEYFSCKIVPAFGGSIQELIIDNLSLINGVTPDNAGFRRYLQFCNSALLFPFPNRVAGGTYTFADEVYTMDINQDELGNAIHGFVYKETPETIAHTDNSLEFGFRHEESRGYPFPYLLKVRYNVSKHLLGIAFEVLNTGSRTMPFGIGWHPYFVTGVQEAFTLHFEADKKYITNDVMIPDRSEPVIDSSFKVADMKVDNAYRLSSGDIVLRAQDRHIKLSVSENNYLQLFSPDDKKSIAIEPMTCIPDAFNNKIGLKTLGPGGTYRWHIHLKINIGP